MLPAVFDQRWLWVPQGPLLAHSHQLLPCDKHVRQRDGLN